MRPFRWLALALRPALAAEDKSRAHLLFEAGRGSRFWFRVQLERIAEEDSQWEAATAPAPAFAPVSTNATAARC